MSSGDLKLVLRSQLQSMKFLGPERTIVMKSCKTTANLAQPERPSLASVPWIAMEHIAS